MCNLSATATYRVSGPRCRRGRTTEGNLLELALRALFLLALLLLLLLLLAAYSFTTARPLAFLGAPPPVIIRVVAAALRLYLSPHTMSHTPTFVRARTQGIADGEAEWCRVPYVIAH